jgi:hypothetical protein
MVRGGSPGSLQTILGGKKVAEIASDTVRMKNTYMSVLNCFVGCPVRERSSGFHDFCPSINISESTLN